MGKLDGKTALIFGVSNDRSIGWGIAKALHAEGFKAQAIHGGRTQRQRQQAIDGFRQGRYTVLVATDVAARGLDVQGISHVVNFDVPNTTDDYVHRIGRTGRANASGIALTLVCPEEGQALRSIERELGNSIPREEWDGAVHIGGGSSERHHDDRRGGQRNGYGRNNGGYRGRQSNDRDRGYDRGGDRQERAARGSERPAANERQERGSDRFERAASGFETQRERSWSPRRQDGQNNGSDRRNDGDRQDRGSRHEGGHAHRAEHGRKNDRGPHAGERGASAGPSHGRQQRAEHGHRPEGGHAREQRRTAGARNRSRGPVRGR